MLIAYLKLKSRITYRTLAEIGLFRLLFLSPLVGLLFFVIFKQTSKIGFGWIIIILVYICFIFQYNFSRKDVELLKTLSKKYWQFLFVDNIIISIPFIALDYRITPILFLTAYLIARLNKKKPSFLNNFKLTKSIFKTGSIEWESIFRQYNVYILTVWLLAFISSIVGNEKYFAFIALVGVGIDSGTVFMKTETLWYVKQYRNKTTYVKNNFRRIIFNVGLPLLIFDAAIITIFPAQFEILIYIYFAIILYLIAAFAIRLAVLDQQFVLNMIQLLFIALIISLFFNIGLLILLSIFLIYISILANKKLKAIYD